MLKSIFFCLVAMSLIAAGGVPLPKTLPRQYFLLFPNVTIRGVTFAIPKLKPQVKEAIAAKLARLSGGEKQPIEMVLDDVQAFVVDDNNDNHKVEEIISHLRSVGLQTQEAIYINVTVPGLEKDPK